MPMPRHNLATAGRRPEDAELLTAVMTARHRLSPHVVRVTLGGGDLANLARHGYDQWFRLFIPVRDDSLEHAPRRLTTASYLRMLTVARAKRPVIRNYTVRDRRGEGGATEVDVDVVVHGEPSAAGPGMRWALECAAGDAVGMLDQGVGFVLPENATEVHLTCDESGLPAVAGILASLSADRPDIVGRAVVELPHRDDRQDLLGPSGVDVQWLVRGDDDRPGSLALAEVVEGPAPASDAYAWAAGEQALASGARRHWVASGLARERVSFCGYWRGPRP
jgi:NADPH-dependent ferric siderophore reductase